MCDIIYDFPRVSATAKKIQETNERIRLTRLHATSEGMGLIARGHCGVVVWDHVVAGDIYGRLSLSRSSSLLSAPAQQTLLATRCPPQQIHQKLTPNQSLLILQDVPEARSPTVAPDPTLFGQTLVSHPHLLRYLQTCLCSRRLRPSRTSPSYYAVS